VTLRAKKISFVNQEMASIGSSPSKSPGSASNLQHPAKPPVGNPFDTVNDHVWTAKDIGLNSIAVWHLDSLLAINDY
jgi:hypothetical protein